MFTDVHKTTDIHARVHICSPNVLGVLCDKEVKFEAAHSPCAVTVARKLKKQKKIRKKVDNEPYRRLPLSGAFCYSRKRRQSGLCAIVALRSGKGDS